MSEKQQGDRCRWSKVNEENSRRQRCTPLRQTAQSLVGSYKDFVGGF